MSESAFGCSPAARAAAEAALAHPERYPDSSAASLVQTIARTYGVDTGQVAVGNGADELLLHCALAFGEPDTGAVVADQTFAVHSHAVIATRLALSTVPLASGRVDVERTLATTAPGAIVYICNPHNPTGNALSRDEVRSLVEGVASVGAMLVLDEAYMEYAKPGSTSTAVEYVHRGFPVIVLRSFSKAHGLAGLRCGYALTTTDLAERLRRIKNALVFNVNRIALAAAEASLNDPTFVASVARRTRGVLDDFRKMVNGHGWAEAMPSETNFVLMSSPLKADDLVGRLTRHRILTKSCGDLGFPRHVRIAAGREHEMRQVVTAIEAIADGRSAEYAPDLHVEGSR